MHIAYISHAIVPKNRLEREFGEYLKTLDRTLVQEEALETFKQEVFEQYDELSRRNRKCKPAPKSWGNSHGPERKDIRLYNSHVHFTLLKIKQ